MFSGEEVYGKYLDLYANHTAYNNLKNIGKRIGYLQYLDVLLLAEKGLIHMDIPKETRLSRDYETCVLEHAPTYILNVPQIYWRFAHLPYVLFAPDPTAA
jgi:splicing factor 3A subunit 3